MTHKKNINMHLKMLRYWDSGKKQFQGILAIITLNESTRIFIVISFILLKKPFLSDLKLYEVVEMRFILLLLL